MGKGVGKGEAAGGIFVGIKGVLVTPAFVRVVTLSWGRSWRGALRQRKGSEGSCCFTSSGPSAEDEVFLCLFPGFELN